MPPVDSIYEVSTAAGALRQGELLSGLIQRVVDIESLAEGRPRVARQEHPFVIVVSQDCDLDWDFKARTNEAAPRKFIPNVLFCEVSDVETFRGTGEINAKRFEQFRSNRDMRYHVLARVPQACDVQGDGTVELAVDFKRYFTLPTDDIYRQLLLGDRIGVQRRTVLRPPFRESLCQRFYYFQSRIALPSEHF